MTIYPPRPDTTLQPFNRPSALPQDERKTTAFENVIQNWITPTLEERRTDTLATGAKTLSEDAFMLLPKGATLNLKA